MGKKICLLSVMLVCTFLVGCSADDMPQDGQELIENMQDEQLLVENLQDAEALMQSPQAGQEVIQSDQAGQEVIQSDQAGQELPQNPQVQTEGSTDDRDLQYEAFLRNEISAANPYVEGMNLTVMDDKGYESEFEDAQKKYAYVDVNGDESPELIFKISSYPSELMYILGIYDNELVCFDVFETHTKNIAFGVYDYGFAWEVQDYDGFEMTFYTYTADGQRMEARHFTEENRADIAAYEGEEPEWIDWQYDGNTGT